MKNKHCRKETSGQLAVIRLSEGNPHIWIYAKASEGWSNNKLSVGIG